MSGAPYLRTFFNHSVYELCTRNKEIIFINILYKMMYKLNTECAGFRSHFSLIPVHEQKPQIFHARQLH